MIDKPLLEVDILTCQLVSEFKSQFQHGVLSLFPAFTSLFKAFW